MTPPAALTIFLPGTTTPARARVSFYKYGAVAKSVDFEASNISLFLRAKHLNVEQDALCVRPCIYRDPCHLGYRAP
jgi:hypothetical protein